MISLFLDTSTSRLIIGIYKDKKQIYFENEESNNDLSRKVLPHIDNALKSVSLDIHSIDEIYVVNGPGSFTGVRVGVTIAKTLAWSLKCKIYTVSELMVLASTNTTKEYIIPMIDARRGYVYGGIYNKKLENIIDDQYIKLDNLKNIIKDKNIMDFEFVSYDGIETSIMPDINFEEIINNFQFTEINPHMVVPNYLKKTEAEEKLNDKSNQ
jgi:tRNA threonylcarbamoyladenosine biosynthesis protein TsaB